MSETDLIMRDPATGLFGFRVELGRDCRGVRMQARRNGFATEKAALVEYRRLSRQRDARRRRPRLSDTVQSVCEDWLTGRVQELQPNTVYNYGWLLSLTYPHVGRVRVSRLSARMVERAYLQLETAGYSRTTLRTVNLVLAKAFGEQTGRTLGAHKPREADEVRPVWKLSEARRFLDHVADDRLHPMWRLLLTTGLRRGELCRLKWSDLEPDLATLTVRRQRVVEDPTSQVREKPPKSHNSTRSLLLDPVTLQTLTDARLWAKAARASGYMFTGRGGQPLRPDTVSSRFNQLAVAACVRPIGPHQVRHLLAGSLLDAGYGIAEVAERLGHDPSTLMRYYSRVNAERRRQAAVHVADLLSSDDAMGDQAGPVRTQQHGRHLTGRANEPAHSGDQPAVDEAP
ncbi:tyrosine-type recombinase/integrase [Virgisporangium aurantiacum]|uniref:Site-specific integrase n=1 Tax=Virgisporangium aurantiacum TaxID=175570 RepID=A0A8J4E4E6_9ACTN|nr:site-specific integrase [Virgisporangium aurantiacum]GIJ61870.1 site-specific integrase [Virgisporangium aurantiacum]